MNVINHYIGMDPMDLGAFDVRRMVPFVYLVFSLFILVFLFYGGQGWWLLGLIPALIPLVLPRFLQLLALLVRPQSS